MSVTPQRAAALIAGVYVGASAKVWYRTDPGDPFTELDFGVEWGPGYFWPFDGTGSHAVSDLAYIVAFMLIDSAGLDFSVSMNMSYGSSYGCLTWTKGASVGSYLEISSRSDGVTQNPDNTDEIFAVLFPDHARAGTYSVVFSGAGDVDVVNSRPCLGVLMPRAYLISDLSHQRLWRGAADSEWAAQNRVYAAKVLEQKIGVRLTGAYPMGVVESEYHQLQDFLDLACQGRLVAIIPDVMASPIERMTHNDALGDPYGVTVGVLRKDDADWSPEALDERWESRWEKVMTFVLPREYALVGTQSGYDLGVSSSDYE